MIELPEAYVLAKQIRMTLTGKRIEQVKANNNPHKFAWFVGDPERYPDKLIGKKITDADVYSGCVRIKAGNMTLLISTPIRYHSKGEKLPKKHQLYIEFDDSTSITCTVQMWGCMFCYAAGHEIEIPIGHIINLNLPSPLEDSFNEDSFSELLKDEKISSLSAKAFLATEQRIPGLGNGVLQDILWAAGIHPKRKMTTLSKTELEAMYNALKNVLREMAEKGGRDTEKDLFGNYGEYKTILSKNSVGKPCPECGTQIIKQSYMGGSIYFCEKCQKIQEESRTIY